MKKSLNLGIKKRKKKKNKGESLHIPKSLMSSPIIVTWVGYKLQEKDGQNPPWHTIFESGLEKRIYWNLSRDCDDGYLLKFRL